MKRLIITTPSVFFAFIIYCTPLLGQKPMQISHACNFATDAKQGTLFTYDPSKEATQIVEKVMKANVLPQNFIIKSADCTNALATTEGKERYILYSTTFLESFKKDAQTAWAAFCVLAHEIGHHLSNHNLEETDPLKRKVFELEADKFAGAALFRMGANLLEAQAGIKTFALEGDSKTHPSARNRLEAIASGWKLAKDIEDDKETLKGELRLVSESDKKKAKELVHPDKKNTEAECYKALELDPNYYYPYYILADYTDDRERAIELLDKAIELNPSFWKSYFLKARHLDRCGERMPLYDKVVQLNPDFQDVYEKRCDCHSVLKNYTKALEDINKAIALETKKTRLVQLYRRRAELHKKFDKNEAATADFLFCKVLRQKYEPATEGYAVGDLVCHLLSLKKTDYAFEITESYLDSILRKCEKWESDRDDIKDERYKIKCYFDYIDKLPKAEKDALKTKISEKWYQKAIQTKDTLAAIKLLQESIFIKPSEKARLFACRLIILRTIGRQEDFEHLKHRNVYEDYLKDILTEQPAHFEANYWANWLMHHSYYHDLDWVLRDFDKKMAVFPDVNSYLLTKAYVTMAADAFGESIAAFDKVLILNPKSDTAWAGKSQAYYELGRYKEAIDCANKALALNPKITTHKKQAEDALKSLATANKSSLAQAVFNKAEKNKNRLTALNYYELALEYKPDFIEPYMKIASLYRFMDKDSLAISTLNKLITLQPRHLEAYETRLDIQKRHNSPMADILNGLEKEALKSPIADELYIMIGIELQDEETSEKALMNFDKAIQKNPKSDKAYSAKGCYLVKLELYKEAVDVLNKAVKINPESNKAQNCLKEAINKL
jgi:tetratricopeptide (TPR) repeat protein